MKYKKPATAAATTVESLEPRALMSGTGLTGHYYDTAKFTRLQFSRVDGAIDFKWGRQSPDGHMGRNTFSVRWRGQVEVAESDVYRFHTRANDGVRVWVDGHRVIDRWERGLHHTGGSIALEGGQKYDLRVDYREVKRNASVKLEWSRPGQARAVVPTAALYATGPGTAPPTGAPQSSPPPVPPAPPPAVEPPPVAVTPTPGPVDPTPDPVTPPPVDPAPVPPEVSKIYSFTLIDADTDLPIPGFEELHDGDTLNYATLPTRNLNIRTNAAPEVATIRFTYDGVPRTRDEFFRPYSYAGDAGGNYVGWTPTAGTHTLTATPFFTDDASDLGGLGKSITFVVID